jgi:peptide chain release factor 2
MFDLEGFQTRLRELDNIMGQPNFWDDPQNAQSLSQERTRLAEQLNEWLKLEGECEDLTLFLDMALSEGDESQGTEISQKMNFFSQELELFELRRILSGPRDYNNAIMDIHSGAGGQDAEDWASMLFRMYLRYCERHKYEVQVLSKIINEEGGTRNVTLTISGPYAYGLLQAEVGVHRLVRVSPFDSNGRRHTSFASVFLTPEIDDSINIDINEKDLRIDTYRASGAGGQHVNKTSSAVRITHLPTGIIVQCQNEKSQHSNRKVALKVLKARLFQLEESKKAQEIKKMHDNKKDIAWGNQIRSYTLHPFRLIKDHRTGLETGNVDAVLEGDLDAFIKSALSWKLAQENSSDV